MCTNNAIMTVFTDKYLYTRGNTLTRSGQLYEYKYFLTYVENCYSTTEHEVRKKQKQRVIMQQKQQFGGNLAVVSDATVCMTLAAAGCPQTISSHIKPSKFYYKIKYFTDCVQL